MPDPILQLDAYSVVSRIIERYRADAVTQHLVRDWNHENEERTKTRMIVEPILDEIRNKYADAHASEPVEHVADQEQLLFILRGTFDGISIEAIEGAIQFLALVAAKKKQDEIDATAKPI